MGVVEVTGTIASVYPPEIDGITGKYMQKVILNNVSTVNTIESVEDRVLLNVKSDSYSKLIEFNLNDPITVKGMYAQQRSGTLSVVHSMHAPLGFIRYNGRIFR